MIHHPIWTLRAGNNSDLEAVFTAVPHEQRDGFSGVRCDLIAPLMKAELLGPAVRPSEDGRSLTYVVAYVKHENPPTIETLDKVAQGFQEEVDRAITELARTERMMKALGEGTREKGA